MKKYKKYIQAKLCLTFVAVLIPVLTNAQCAMCRAVLESQDDNSMAEGINNGIVYLMALPYLIVGALMFIVYRKMRTNKV